MVYLDGSIMQKGEVAAPLMKMLENFTAPFDATTVTRLKKAKIPIGGGISKGSPFLSSDVFGFARNKAAEHGWFYIRPTYGTVSRYGLIPWASSMDQIGIQCIDVLEGFKLLSVIAGHDEKDGAMFPEKSHTYERTDAKVESFEPKYADVYDPVIKILAYGEMGANLSRYDGIRFGCRAPEYKGLDELYTKTRTEWLGAFHKVASVIGCMVLSQENYTRYYGKAMKIRRLIKDSLRFDEYDVLKVPAGSHLAVLAGLPSLTFSHKGEGVQLVANVKNEGALLTAWEELQ